MEEERIKSALEIAMDRISGLPQLTPEEIAEQKEKEYRPIGEALGRKYLEGKIADSDVSEEINKYRGDPNHIIRRAFILSLCRSIQLEDPRITGRALHGMMQLRPEEEVFFASADKDYREIFDGFELDKEKKSGEFENLERERLQSLGISGSAVRLNPAVDESLQRNLEGIRRAYEPKLEQLKDMVLRKFKKG